MGEIVEVLPNYCPKIDENINSARDLDRNELIRIYPKGFKCCGKIYEKTKFTQFRASHIKTKIHKENVIDPETNNYRENLGDCDSLVEAFQKKCKETRQIKSLLIQKQIELDKQKLIVERLMECNIDLQEKNKDLKKKIKPPKLSINDNLIDFDYMT
jgi:regulator of replication initiation timing